MFDKSLLIWGENFNKNYRLPLERLYGRRIFKNEEYRKKFLGGGLVGGNPQ
jgi:hypothetical protein